MLETSHHNQPGISEREREAVLALWAVPGIGVKTVENIRAWVKLSEVFDQSPRVWLDALRLPTAVRENLAKIDRLSSLAELVRERAEQGEMEIAFKGTPAYPAHLATVDDSPPLLFHRGEPLGGARPFVALVGSRNISPAFKREAERFARECVQAGLGVVSGAALGVDQACHWGALCEGGETWAFLGSALDELDPAQAKQLPHFLERGGTFFSDLPPGVRASRDTFPRRNRLISGASQCVVVLRAKQESGSIHTATYAVKQGRPVLAMPGPEGDPTCFGSNWLLTHPTVGACHSVADVCQAIDFEVKRAEEIAARPVLSAADDVSEAAQRAYGLVTTRPCTFEEIHRKSGMASAALTSALCELELAGLVVQHPGKLFEKV